MAFSCVNFDIIVVSCIKLCILYHNQRLTGTNHKHYEAPTRTSCYFANQQLQKQFHTKSFWSFQKFIMEMFLPALSPFHWFSDRQSVSSGKSFVYMFWTSHQNFPIECILEPFILHSQMQIVWYRDFL